MGRTIFVLVISKILALFFNTLTTDDNYSLNRENLPQTIQLQISKKQKETSESLAQLLQSNSYFQHIEKKMTFIPHGFLK